jgi:hypothetical protein
VSAGRPTHKRRFDAPLVVVGGLGSGVLALGAAVLFDSRVDTGSAGPTAATLTDAFGLLYGAAIGLALGAAVVAAAARAEPRIVTGVLAGLVGYGAVLAPVLIATRPADVSTADAISAAAFAAIFVTPAILLGAAVGAAVGNRRRRRFTGWRTHT